MEQVIAALSNPRSAALALGATTVVLTHTYMLLAPEHDMEDPEMLRNHAVLYLAAGAAVVWGSKMLG